MNQVNKTQLNKLRTLLDKNKAYVDTTVFSSEDDSKKFSRALSMSILMEYLNLNQTTAFESLTDGADDNKIDAFYYSDDEDEISELIIVQSKYKKNDGDTDTISEDDIKLCIKSCENILNGGNFQYTNAILQRKLAEYRELLQHNDMPPVSIRLFFATNGIVPEIHKQLNEVVDCADKNIDVVFADATFFGSNLVSEKGELNINLKNKKDKTDSIFSIGDDLYSGVIVSCSVKEMMAFYKANGERSLLTSNVRYLLKKSSINKEIKKSFIEDPSRFCYLNNGVSIVCSDYKILPTALSQSKIELTRPSIVNGGQTMSTLYQLYTSRLDELENKFESANILIRIYKVPKDYSIKIAKATNSQNPIDIVDLHSNDLSQKIAKEYLEKFGIGLMCKEGDDISFYDDIITNENILQIYAALYRDDPAKAKVSKALIFKKYYNEVFNESINESICKKLYRCYQISRFVSNQSTKDLVILKNGFYSLIYAMKKIDINILNENIPDKEIQKHFIGAFNKAFERIMKIINLKQNELKTKFSMNNLFKGNEIKDLIDLSLSEVQITYEE